MISHFNGTTKIADVSGGVTSITTVTDEGNHTWHKIETPQFNVYTLLWSTSEWRGIDGNQWGRYSTTIKVPTEVNRDNIFYNSVSIDFGDAAISGTGGFENGTVYISAQNHYTSSVSSSLVIMATVFERK